MLTGQLVPVSHRSVGIRTGTGVHGEATEECLASVACRENDVVCTDICCARITDEKRAFVLMNMQQHQKRSYIGTRGVVVPQMVLCPPPSKRPTCNFFYTLIFYHQCHIDAQM